MNKLSQLRRKLARLRRRRRLSRMAAGMGALALGIFWTGATLFLVDWQLDMGRAERLVAMVISAAAVSWVFWRFTWPWISRRETEVDVALLVEREHQIDSDLVAALQFDAPEAPRWGSVRLKREVIDLVAELSGRLDVMKGFRWAMPVQRVAVLVLTGTLVGLGVWRFPDHARVFLDRLLLEARRYPTRTVIEVVKVNDRAVRSSDGEPDVTRIPRGDFVRFDVTCSGRLPASGRIELTGLDNGRQVRVALKAGQEGGAVYRGTLSQLVESIDYRIHVGDTWTEPARLLMVPPPLVWVEFAVTPPDYVAGPDRVAQTFSGVEQISVLEGSRVVVHLSSNKSLQEVTLSIGRDRFGMVRQQDSQAGRDTDSPTVATGSDRWILAPGLTSAGPTSPATKNPLASVQGPIAYGIEVTDTDGMHPEHLVRGLIRIRPDHPPSVLASAVTRYVLPTAHPEITYTATDDHGLAELSILPVVTRADGHSNALDEIPIFKLAAGQPADEERSGRHRLDLGPLDLSKGDQVEITIRAVDYRGRVAEGRSSQSRTLLFQVTDVEGILAAIGELDRESARRLQTMIQEQIDVGETP